MLKGLGSLGGLGDMAKMMKAAQEMQGKIAELQESFARMNVVGEAGAGLVTATCTVKGEVRALDINASILDPTQKEVVEDLIVAAANDARAKVEQTVQEQMRGITGGLPLPPGFKL